jgi:hypothetical protein
MDITFCNKDDCLARTDSEEESVFHDLLTLKRAFRREYAGFKRNASIARFKGNIWIFSFSFHKIQIVYN